MKLTLSERRPEVPGVESFIFTPEKPLEWKAGQFLHYVLHHEPTDDRGSDRWFTVASAPFEQHVMITTRLAEENGSSFKRALKEFNLGDVIEISDVDGDFTIDDTAAQYVFIAGGIGITPFHSILKEFEHHGVKLNAKLIYSNRDANIPYKAELDRLASANENLKIDYVVSGRIDEERIHANISDLQKPIFYISGPEPMVNSLSELLKNMGVPDATIKGDWFPGYTAESAHA